MSDPICPACNAIHVQQEICRLCECAGLVDEMTAAAWRLGGMEAAVPCPLCTDPASPWLLVRSEVVYTTTDPYPYFETGGQVCVLHPYHEAPLASDAAAFRLVGWDGVKHLLKVEITGESMEVVEFMMPSGDTRKLPGWVGPTEVQIRSPAGTFNYESRR